MAGKRKEGRFGPGFLVAAAFIGPGTVTTCSIAGANFGYGLLYALVFAVITTIILQEMTGRLSLASGHDLAESLREFPDRALTKILFIIITISAITIGCAAYEAGNIIGGSIGIEIITSVDQKIWAAVISLIAAAFLASKKYKLIEKFLVGLVFLMSISFLGTAIIIGPDILSILKGFVPSFPDNSIYIALALVGTTVVPYNLFLHSSAVKQKWKSMSDIKLLRKDLVVSILLGGIISGSIVITSAAAFYLKGKQIESGAELAVQLEPMFGTFTNILFGIGFASAGLSSALTAPYAASFATSGVLGWKGEKRKTGFTVVSLTVIAIGLIVSMLGLKPIAVIVFAQVANGLILPVASIFLLIILNKRKRLRGYANKPLNNILAVIVIIIVIILSIFNIQKIF